MIKDTDSLEEDMWPFYHEAGHWIIARALGYEGYLTGNLKENNNFNFIQTSPKVLTPQGLKNQILIAFGGLSSEKLLDIPINAGAIGDLTIACEDLKQLHSLEGKTFEYNNYLDFPDKDYDYYLSQGQIVLEKLGGKKAILDTGNYFHGELKKAYQIK